MNRKRDFVTAFFWLIIVFYLDPGGFIDANYRTPLGKLINNYGFVLLAWICYFIKNKEIPLRIFREDYVKKYLIILSVWYLYYLGWFYGLNNPFLPGPLQLFTHNYRMLSQGLIVIPLIYFTIISVNKFIQYNTNVTIIILLLLFITLTTPLKIIETLSFSRGFVEADRFFMLGNGLIYFSLPVAISSYALGLKTNFRIMLAGAMVVVLIFLTLTRRSLVGIFEYIIIISILVSLAYRIRLYTIVSKFLKARIIIVAVTGILVVSALGFSFIRFSGDFIKASIAMVTMKPDKDNPYDYRLSLTKNVSIVSAIKENFWTGTGFDPAWQSGEGGGKGWEGADYVFLSCFAMYGILGLAIFLFFYVLVAKVIITCSRMIRANLTVIRWHMYVFGLPLVVFIASASEFIKNIIEYPNWFIPIGMMNGTQEYYIYFGLMTGSFIAIRKKLRALQSRSIAGGLD